MMTRDDRPVEKKLETSMFLVEATSTEQHFLWADHSKESTNYRLGTELEWIQVNPGHLVHVGDLAGHEIWIQVNTAILAGQQVAFWDATSKVVDYDQVRAWLKKHFTRTYDGGRSATCDAMNFGHCLSAIRERTEGCYEIIVEDTVIGVLQGGRFDLMHAAAQDRVTHFGKLTKTQFDQFNDGDGWETPISTERWTPEELDTILR